MWDPFKDMKRVQGQLNKRVNDFIGLYKKPYSNITQNSRFVIINVELPEIKKKNIFLQVDDDKLVVKAENKSRVVKEKKGSYYEAEKAYGYYRAITLPKGVAIDKTKAKFLGRVLKIVIPKRKMSKKISIK